jgi:pyridoxal phosphate enzyme (YggS family)
MIKENIENIFRELSEGVQLVAAAKSRTPEEIREAIDSGIQIIGHNYVQEAERAWQAIGPGAKWHMIGHLQSNKAKIAARIFDMIETVDTTKLAEAIDRACREINKIMPVLIEVNSGEEGQKAGVLPKDAVTLIKNISALQNVRVMGLMTMGPFSDNPEDSRPYYKRTRTLFDEIKAMNIPGVEMRFLSMGMSGSYRVAIEEGANLVRIGTMIFGERARK